jgi:hypothetical protein
MSFQVKLDVNPENRRRQPQRRVRDAGLKAERPPHQATDINTDLLANFTSRMNLLKTSTSVERIDQ